MRKSKFSNQHLIRVRFTIKRRLKKSLESKTRLLSSRDFWLYHRTKQPAFQISAERYSSFKRSTLSSSRRQSSSLMSSRSPLMFTDGASWSAQTQRPMSLFRRSRACRSVWLRRQRRSQRRMSSFKRRRSSTLSSRTYWRSRVDQRSLRSFKFISRI